MIRSSSSIVLILTQRGSALIKQCHFYKHMSQVVNGKAAIKARRPACRPAMLGTTPEFWLNLQNAVDLWDARQELAQWQPPARYVAEPGVVPGH
jgi:plasmid maintenance system antidote protein VapI